MELRLLLMSGRSLGRVWGACKGGVELAGTVDSSPLLSCPNANVSDFAAVVLLTDSVQTCSRSRDPSASAVLATMAELSRDIHYRSLLIGCRRHTSAKRIGGRSTACSHAAAVHTQVSIITIIESGAISIIN
jgi:hypothetical protein